MKRSLNKEAALMRCAGVDPDEENVERQFRQSIGLHNIDSQWTVLHDIIPCL